MEALIHNDHRQQPITSDEACGQYREYLARLEAMIQDQEGVVLRARQGVVDAFAAYAGARPGVKRSE
jgi:outer membrane protein TolC